ncbi:hypothetical protein QTP86_025974 [Hemibagrus guttatus]|nr:hypothetical protein QTP86_025974 [Hemibagrus guttatus]
MFFQVSLDEAEEKHQKAVETITQLEEERTDLTGQVKTLQGTMENMRNQLCDTLLQCEEEQEAHSHLKSEYHEMMETLTNSEKLLKVSLDEAEEKHQKAVETITQLEEERFNLTDQVKTLRDTVEEMGNQLCDTLLQCEEEQEAHSHLKSEYHEMMETLTNSEKLLMVSLAEAEEKYQKAVETITQLEEKESNLTVQVKTLQDTVEEMGNQLCDTRLQCEEEQEAHSHLKSEYHEMMETLTNSEKLLKKIKSIMLFFQVSLAEVLEKHQKAVETIIKLEEEKSILTVQVNTLRDTLEDMENQLFESLLQCEEEQEAHSHLKSEYREMMETLTNSEKLLKVSLDEAEEKHQKAVETITQLEEERFNLTDQVKTLQDTVEEMGNQLCDTLLQCEEEQEAHSHLKSEYHEMMETLTKNRTLLKVSLDEAEEKYQKAVETITQLEEERTDLTGQVSLDEAEEKHQKAVETITQLEEERTDLTEQVNTLRETVEEMGNQLFDIFRQRDQLRNDYEEQQEAHGHLKSEYHEMMETLTNSEKLLKKFKKTLIKCFQVSLDEAEEKHQKAVETITQLEGERTDLTGQVNTLRDTVEDMGNQLCDTHLQCDELKNECEEEQEAHRLLKSEYHEMMETLTKNRTLLKVSLDEAEEKHQKAVETITQLEEIKSDLTDQVKTLRDTVKDMENQLCDTRLQCEEEQEAHSHLKSEYHEMMETLTNSEKLLKVNILVSLDEAEEKHQKAVETITQLEEERTDLTEQVNTLRETVEEMGNQLFDIFRQRDQLRNDYEEQQEAHGHLKSEYHEMMETLTNSEKLLKVKIL